jgi:DNA modification methylase
LNHSIKFNIDLDKILSKEKNYSTHNFHPYPAKFIPQIPRELLNYIDLPPRSVVLDPFCGCGTTLVESNILGFNAIGVDSNPIACLVSKVKTTPLSNQSIENINKMQ